MEFYEFRAMKSAVVLAAEGAPEQVAAGFQAARSCIAVEETRFSRFSAQSELVRLNASQGEWFSASTDLFEVVQLALDYFGQTGGLFDPAILPDLKRAGYDRSMDELRLAGAVPAGPRIERPGFETLQLDRQHHCIWMPPGMEIDLGGIAKGWIAEQAARRMAGYTPVCTVSAGGDLFSIGLPQETGAWEVALEDPRDPEQYLAILEVGAGAVATSSVIKRSWQQGGKSQHHLIDPRSGEPAQSEWLSVTVIAPQAAAAEVFAKALLIAGPRQVSQILAGHPGLAYIAIDRRGSLWGSPESQEYLHANR